MKPGHCGAGGEGLGEFGGTVPHFDARSETIFERSHSKSASRYACSSCTSQLMSSFFTLPASQRKRKRDKDIAPTASKRRTKSSKADALPRTKGPKPRKEDSISGSESEEENQHGLSDAESASSEFDSQDDTAAERRLRLAERYLENIKEQVQEDEFNVEDVDKEIIASRLKEDVV